MINDELKKTARHIARLAKWIDGIAAESAEEAGEKYTKAAEKRVGGDTPHDALMTAAASAREALVHAKTIAEELRILASKFTDAARLGAAATAVALREAMEQTGLDTAGMTDQEILKERKSVWIGFLKRMYSGQPENGKSAAVPL